MFVLQCAAVAPVGHRTFASHNWIFGQLIHADTRRERSILTTLLIGSTSNAISASLSLACLTFRHTELTFWHPNDVSGSCHMVFWPRNSNTIFEGKMAQLSRLVKSSILTLNISNFGIVYLKRYISKICEKRFRFIGTLMSVVILITYASSTIMIGNHINLVLRAFLSERRRA